MQQVDAREDGDNTFQQFEMRLIDPKGQTRTRNMQAWSKDFGADTYSRMVFKSPSDMRHTGVLIHDFRQQSDDDQWLYLPSLHKTKRVASGDQRSSFFGSDFSYADLTRRQIDNYHYKRLDDQMIDGNAVWQVEATPKTAEEQATTGYKRSVFYVRKDNYVPIRVLHQLEKKGVYKLMQVNKLEMIEDIWVATQVTMATLKQNRIVHRTVMTYNQVKFNQALQASDFNLASLEQHL